MKVAIIVGSIRKGRQSDKVALYLHKLLQESPQIVSQYLDLAAHELPLLNDKWEQQESIDSNLEYVSIALKEADALLLVSPEYHGSYTGVLKNAVDHYWGEFSRKAIGVVCTGSGKFGGINASSQMQQLILSLGAFPMPRKLIIPYIQNAFDEKNEPVAKELKQECSSFLEEFLWFGHAITTAKLLQAKPEQA